MYTFSELCPPPSIQKNGQTLGFGMDALAFCLCSYLSNFEMILTKFAHD